MPYLINRETTSRDGSPVASGVYVDVSSQFTLKYDKLTDTKSTLIGISLMPYVSEDFFKDRKSVVNLAELPASFTVETIETGADLNSILVHTIGKEYIIAATGWQDAEVVIVP